MKPHLVGNKAVLQANSVEWWTPQDILEIARQVLGNFDLDPASCDEANELVKATRYFTKEENGLLHPWRGNVWMNPPYGKLASKFVEKLLMEHYKGNVKHAIILLNSNSCETKWFQPLWSHTLCFYRGRIKFQSPDILTPSPTHGAVLVYVGKGKGKKFLRDFREVGNVVKLVRPRP